MIKSKRKITHYIWKSSGLEEKNYRRLDLRHRREYKYCHHFNGHYDIALSAGDFLGAFDCLNHDFYKIIKIGRIDFEVLRGIVWKQV